MYHSNGKYDLDFLLNAERATRYYAYKPNGLNGSNNIFETDEELISLLLKTNQLLGTLNGMAVFVPDIEIFINFQIEKEATYSCQIDDSNASFTDIENYKKMLTTCQNQVVNNALLCRIHSILLSTFESGEVGKFRTKPILMQKYFTDGAMKEFNPPRPEDLSECTNDLEQFFDEKKLLDPLMKLALIHYQFETIHPFEFGNGVTGRALAMLMLMQEGLLAQPLLSVSRYLYVNKIEYFDRLSSVQRGWEYKQWIKFFIKAILTGAEIAIEQIKAYVSLKEKNEAKLIKLERSKDIVQKALQYIEQNKTITIRKIADKFNISYNTASNIVKALENLNILKQANQQTRYRVYEYKELLDIFQV